MRRHEHEISDDGQMMVVTRQLVGSSVDALYPRRMNIGPRCVMIWRVRIQGARLNGRERESVFSKRAEHGGDIGAEQQNDLTCSD